MANYSKHHQQVGAIGGLTRAARQTNEDGRKAAAKAGFMARFYAEVPADVTDETERARLANLAMRAHMKRLAVKSAQKRGKPRGRAA